MTPFFKNAEPLKEATIIRLSNAESHIDIPFEFLPYLFFQFAKEGKRLYEDNGVDSFVYTVEDGYQYEFKHVTHIEVR
mgnify:FL=1